jgi:hypothetical protein
MLDRALRGIIAGATGTMALDVTTYGDMLVRGRSASNVPATVASNLADALGIGLLGSGATGEKVANRRSATGALLGYATGLGIGGVYGVIRGQGGRVPTPLAGVAVGVLAMVASDLPIALTGASDPRTWISADWLSDLIPHLVYGLVTVKTYEFITAHEDEK